MRGIYFRESNRACLYVDEKDLERGEKTLNREDSMQQCTEFERGPGIY